jgi:hypothetical protein
MKRKDRRHTKMVVVDCRQCPYGHREHGRVLGPVIYCPFPKCACKRLVGKSVDS